MEPMNRGQNGHIQATSRPHPGHIHGSIPATSMATSRLARARPRCYTRSIVESSPFTSQLNTYYKSNSITAVRVTWMWDGGLADGLHLHVATFASLRSTRVVVTADHRTECNHLHHACPLFDRFPTLDPVTRALLL